MKRRNKWIAWMCAACVAVSAFPAVVMAEETETETVAEEAARISTEEETETEAAQEEELVYPEYKALDYVKLGEYKGLTVVKESADPTEEETAERVRHNVQLADALETLTEGTVQVGDIANIDYEGKLDEVAFNGGTAKGYDLEIGSDTFIDGFEDGLVGVAVGETVDLNLTFPEQYPSEDLAGKETVFTVTVNEIRRVPELTDGLVQEISEGAQSTVAEYEQAVRDELKAEKEASLDTTMKMDLFNQVVNLSEITDYPQELLDYSVASTRSYYKEYATMYGVEWADFLSAYLGMTEEQFEEQALLAAKEAAGQEMYLRAIAEAENLELSDQEYIEGAADYAERYGFDSLEALEEQYGKEMIISSLLQEKVLNFLLENAVITEAETETEAATDVITEAGVESAETESEEAAAEAESEEETAAEAGETEAPAETENE